MQRWGVLAGGSFFVLLILTGAGEAPAQASPTASKSSAMSLFGMYTRGDTDRSDVTGQTHINNGATIGGDYTHYFHRIVTPSLELRAKFLPGGTVGQTTFVGGLRLEHRWGNFVPYAVFFAGYGRLTFTHPDRSGPGPPYTHDNSIVFASGPGLDYDLTSNWSLQADYLFERWHIGRYNGFIPQAFSVGLLYRIPFKPFQRQ